MMGASPGRSWLEPDPHGLDIRVFVPILLHRPDAGGGPVQRMREALEALSNDSAAAAVPGRVRATAFVVGRDPPVGGRTAAVDGRMAGHG